MPKSGEEMFAKQQLGEPHPGGSSLLGLGWDKTRDNIIISFTEWESDPTKEGVLRKLAIRQSSYWSPLSYFLPFPVTG